MASNAGRLALGALAAAAIGVAVIWLVPTPETTLVSPTQTIAPADVQVTQPTETAQTEETDLAVSSEDSAPLVAVPTLGMRAESDGILVVTGRAQGAELVDVLLDAVVLERLLVDSTGAFATVLSIEPSEKARILSVVADPDGAAIASVQNPLILPVGTQEPILSSDAPLIAGAVSVEAPDAEQEIASVETTSDQPVAEALEQASTETDVASIELDNGALSAEPEAETLADDTQSLNVSDVAVTSTLEAIEEPLDPISEEASEVVAAITDPTDADVQTANEVTSEVAEVAEVAAPNSLPDIVEPSEEQAVAEAIDEAVADTVLVADEGGVRVVPTAGAAPQVLSSVALDAISYDPTGEVVLTGRATGEGFVQVYVDNQPVTTSRIDASGDWRTDLPEVDTGVYTLRIDEVDAAGEVVSRIETPFKREEPETVAAVMAEETEKDDFRVAVRTVQPGATLWAIAREQFGDGIMYVAVYEANKDQIRDPNLIYPGQVFQIPEMAQ